MCCACFVKESRSNSIHQCNFKQVCFRKDIMLRERERERGREREGERDVRYIHGKHERGQQLLIKFPRN